MPTILIDEPLHPEILKAFPDDWELVYMTDEPDQATLNRVDGMFVYAHPNIDSNFLERVPNITIVANFGVGVSHINVSDMSERGVLVTNTPGTLHHATADLTAGLILAITRRIVQSHHFATGPTFDRYDPHLFWGMELHGAVLGIIGMGQIGVEIARRMHHGFGMNILYHNRNPVCGEIASELRARYCAKDMVLSIADVVVLMTPLTMETQRMIGANELGMMKQTAFLVNTSRGGVLDTEALVCAIRDRRIAGVALDVTDPEPLPRDHPLLSMENVIVTPHIGSATLRTRIAMAECALKNLKQGLCGERPADQVLL